MEPAKVIEFVIETPADGETLRRNIASSMARGLPEIDDALVPDLHIVANGPGAVAFFDRPVDKMPANSVALNGALGLFTARGLSPQYWMACDPQAQVADFLTVTPADTIYVVASKCHAQVLDRLRDRDVRLWHINDQPIDHVRAVPCAVSVTLCALMQFQRLGYRRIHVWGWDCAFGENGSHHANGSHAPKSDVIELTVGQGGPMFKTTATWAAETKDALGIIPVLEWCGTEVVIHGDSLVKAALLFASDQPRQAA